MSPPVAGCAKTVGKIVIGLAVTVIGGFFALANGTYGALGIYAGFKQRLALSEAAWVYWSLFLIAIISAIAVIATWVLLFRGAKLDKPPS
jgi:hypothetical protein